MISITSSFLRLECTYHEVMCSYFSDLSYIEYGEMVALYLMLITVESTNNGDCHKINSRASVVSITLAFKPLSSWIYTGKSLERAKTKDFFCFLKTLLMLSNLYIAYGFKFHKNSKINR